jgi:hypothetical protein
MRTVGMTASPDLLSEWRRHWPHWGAWWQLSYRVTALAIGVGALMAFTVLAFIAEAH